MEVKKGFGGTLFQLECCCVISGNCELRYKETVFSTVNWLVETKSSEFETVSLRFAPPPEKRRGPISRERVAPSSSSSSCSSSIMYIQWVTWAVSTIFVNMNHSTDDRAKLDAGACKYNRNKEGAVESTI